VSICSIAENRRGVQPINLTILDAGISPGSVAELQSYCASIGVSISFIDMRAATPAGLKSPSWTDTWSPAMYARLFIARAVPFPKVIYLDSDTTVHVAIKDLWAIDLHGHSIAAAVDPAIVPGITPNARRVGSYPSKPINLGFYRGTWRGYFQDYLGLDDSAYGSYFNSGVLVMDLDKIRAYGSDEACIAMIERPYAYGDQCILNYVYSGDVEHLPPRWNCFNIPATRFNHLDPVQQRAYQQAQQRPGVIHHVKKPFRNRYAKWSGLYWKYLARTPWNARVRKKYLLLATAVGFVKFIGMYPLLFKFTKAIRLLTGVRVRFF